MPSKDAKQRWNATHYTQVKVSVHPEIAAAFKETCVKNGTSQASVLSAFMVEYSRQNLRPSAKKALDTRKKRRTAIKNLSSDLEELLDEEERYYENVPENLHGSKWHEASENAITAIQDIINLLSEIYD